MKQNKTNTFGALRYIGLCIICLPAIMVLIFIGSICISTSKDKPLYKQVIDSTKKEKAIEIVYIHDTLEINCMREHCDERIQNKTEIKHIKTVTYDAPVPEDATQHNDKNKDTLKLN